METSKYALVLVVTISSICAISMAQPSSSGISNECANVLITLQPCLNYINGNTSTPSSDCCTQLGSVVRSSPQCLCQVLNAGNSGLAASLNINATQALTLPNACNVQTPPLSRCNAASPAGSPTGSPTIPSLGGGSRTTPTGDSSDANMSKLPAIPMLLAILYVASQALAF